ncbi:MlaD family protein [Burkholderia sp. Ac-20353]|uniref:PqiB family protein n=1 Tax=Burkholderia sp. Ac-20353 TaxID=2703894 RepID=UPI00197BB836|nr:MlaD family protein [Burkholderia sp. Ac-20353]MBN3789167.1 MCE family protein [Burkholderia sp. Ac-20353]
MIACGTSKAVHERWKLLIQNHREAIVVGTRWLLMACCAPLAALLVVLLSAIGSPSETAVTVRFVNAEGLEPGKTIVRYRGVEIGRLTTLDISADRTKVLATLRLVSTATRFTRCDARFWIVRPSVDLTGVSRLDTAFSGPYVGVDIGNAPQQCRDFDGRETPPPATRDSNGTLFVLHAASMGSLRVGSPVYLKQIRVGSVLATSLPARGDGVDISAWVAAPFDRYVTANTRWWHASGMATRLGSEGFKLDVSSLPALWSGGIGFESPVSSDEGARGVPDAKPITLFASRIDALRQADDGPAASVIMRFAASSEGLSVGAPVDFHGVEIGEITAIAVDFDMARQRSQTVVTMNLYPARLGTAYSGALGNGDNAAGRGLLRDMVRQGLRGQLRVGSLLTEKRYIALDFFPRVAPVNIDTHHPMVELPTVPNTFESLRSQLVGIGDRLSHFPFDEVGHHFDEAIKSAGSLVQQFDTELAPRASSARIASEQLFDAAAAVRRTGKREHSSSRDTHAIQHERDDGASISGD